MARGPVAIMCVLAALVAACGSTAEPPATRFNETVSAPGAPGQAQRLAVMARVSGYWAALEAGRLGTAYEFLTLDYRETWPFPRFSSQGAAFRTPRRVTKLHWLRDSRRMPGPELFAVVEWTAGPAESPLEWGRMVWRQDAGTFLMQSSEQRPGSGP